MFSDSGLIFDRDAQHRFLVGLGHAGGLRHICRTVNGILAA